MSCLWIREGASRGCHGGVTRLQTGLVISVKRIVRHACIIVNLQGRRFHDELDMQPVNLALAAKEQPEERYFGIVDQAFVDAAGAVRNAVAANTIEELAEMLGVSPAGLADEVAHYNEMYDAGEGTDFHRLSMAITLRTPPVYGCELFTGLHGFDGDGAPPLRLLDDQLTRRLVVGGEAHAHLDQSTPVCGKRQEIALLVDLGQCACPGMENQSLGRAAAPPRWEFPKRMRHGRRCMT